MCLLQALFLQQLYSSCCCMLLWVAPALCLLPLELHLRAAADWIVNAQRIGIGGSLWSAAGSADTGMPAQRQAFSISVANLVKLIRFTQTLPSFRLLGRGLTSNDIREFLMREGKHAREVFGDFYTEEQAVAVLTYEWTLELKDICSFLNGPTIRQYNSQARASIPSDPEKLTVWIDVFQLDQNVSDMKGQLLLSEAEYIGAPEHIILGTSSVGGRAWCLHEAATRARVGKRSHVLKSLRCDMDPRFDITSFVATTSGRFYEEMRATMPADLELIRQRIKETYGNPERFNGALLCIFQEAAF
jgi:hypothetical protein